MQLDSVKWKLNLQMAESSKSKVKMPSAVVELGLKGSKVINISMRDGISLLENSFERRLRNLNIDWIFFQELENVCLEFTHEELYSFYDQVCVSCLP